MDVAMQDRLSCNFAAVDANVEAIDRLVGGNDNTWGLVQKQIDGAPFWS